MKTKKKSSAKRVTKSKVKSKAKTSTKKIVRKKTTKRKVSAKRVVKSHNRWNRVMVRLSDLEMKRLVTMASSKRFKGSLSKALRHLIVTGT